jgi:hypothetical protein
MNKDHSISQELRELSPALGEWLAGLEEGGRRPFRVPDGYFEELKSGVFAFVDSGLAGEMGKSADGSFQVPENYFEGLAGDIMRKIGAEEVGGGGKVIDLQEARRREPIPVRRWTVMAASVALFIALGVLAARFITLAPPSFDELAETISDEEVLDYLAGSLDDITYGLDSDDLLALVDLNGEGPSLGVSSDMEEELNQYLEENIDDLEEYLLTGEI